MKANERLRNIIRVGYLETSSKNSKVQPELNPINIDNTDYRDESFMDNYKTNRRETTERKKMQALFKEFAQEDKNNNVAGFWESYFHGLGLVFKFMGKVAIFIIGFIVTLWIWNMIF